MTLLEKTNWSYVPAVYTDDYNADCIANTQLYLKLLKEGEEKCFCPVLADKNIKPKVLEARYELTGSNEDYRKRAEYIIREVENNCFNVWMGRIIYNYYLDGIENNSETEYDLEMLVPPENDSYINKFDDHITEKEFSFSGNEKNHHYSHSFDDMVFFLVPTKRPWEIPAWIPIGGFNWCPNEIHQTALAKELYESYGARLMFIANNCMEYYIPKALFDSEKVKRLSKILIAADNDVYEDFEVSADIILGSHNLPLWWD